MTMDVPSYFRDFLKDIRLTPTQRDGYKAGHRVLRARLASYGPLKNAIVSTFLQGSYRRATAVRPQGDRRPDVDIIVVTALHESEFKPAQVLDLFYAFANKHYEGKCRQQGRSIGIELDAVDLDLVPTAAPSEAEYGILESESVTDDEDLEEATDWRLNRLWLSESTRAGRSDARAILAAARAEPEWKAHPLRIPDSHAGTWESTHPLAQLQWTRDKNARCGGHFVNVVKALKWWRNETLPDLKHPKGFPVERIIGECCPDDIESIAEGVARTLAGAVEKFRGVRLMKGVPQLPDYGVPTHDVLKRIDGESFATLYDAMSKAADTAKAARTAQELDDSVRLWRDLFGSKFPPPPSGGITGGYTPREKVSVPGAQRFG
jgi:hypothetical protein